MSDLKVLFVGGSGVISSACSRLAVERGIELSVLNRGSTTQRPLPAGAAVLRGDIRDPASVREALGDREFDAVVDWVAFTPSRSRLISTCCAAAPASTSSSAPHRRTRRRPPVCRS
jgi:nucleoside-diphosphate-sugar epimerase